MMKIYYAYCVSDAHKLYKICWYINQQSRSFYFFKIILKNDK